jgi:hypothetical protein
MTIWRACRAPSTFFAVYEIANPSHDSRSAVFILVSGPGTDVV